MHRAPLSQQGARILRRRFCYDIGSIHPFAFPREPEVQRKASRREAHPAIARLVQRFRGDRGKRRAGLCASTCSRWCSFPPETSPRRVRHMASLPRKAALDAFRARPAKAERRRPTSAILSRPRRSVGRAEGHAGSSSACRDARRSPSRAPVSPEPKRSWLRSRPRLAPSAE